MSRNWPEQIEVAPLQEKLAAYYRRRVHNRCDVDDLVQDALLTALQRKSRFRFATERPEPVEQQVECWVMGIAKKKLVEYCRTQHQHRENLEALGEIGRQAMELHTLAPQDFTDSDETAKIVLIAMRKCPKSLREVAGHFLIGRSPKEIAKICSLSKNVVYARLSRLRKRVGKLLRKHQLEAGDRQVLFSSNRDNNQLINEFLRHEAFSKIASPAEEIPWFQTYVDQCQQLSETQKECFALAGDTLHEQSVSDDTKHYVLTQLFELAIELQKPQPSSATMNSYVSRIQESAEPVAQILVAFRCPLKTE